MTRRIVISGAASSIGRALVTRLHSSSNALTLIDPRLRGANIPPDMEVLAKTPRSSSVRNVVNRGADTWIHIAIEPPLGQDREWCSDGTQFLAEYLTTSAVKTFIYVSSAVVYGALPDNPIFIPPDAPLRGAHNPWAAPRVEGDLAASMLFWKAPHIRTVIVRPTFLLGPVDTIFARYLRLERPPVLMGFDPMVAPVHLDDLVGFILRAIYTSEARGTYNLKGPDIVPLRTILHRHGKEPLIVPSEILVNSMLRGIAPYLKYSCIGDDRQIPDVLKPPFMTQPFEKIEETLIPDSSLLPQWAVSNTV